MSHQRSLTLPVNLRVVPTSGPTRRSPAALALSIALHLLIGIALLLRIRQDFVRIDDAGSLKPGTRGGGGGGGGRVAYISIPAEAPRAAAPEVATPPVETPPPVPVEPTPVPPVTTPPVTEQPPVAASTGTASPDSLPGVGPGQGGGTGGGTGGGQGPGVGPGSGPGVGTGGDGGTGRGPELRHQIIPPSDPPKELRGIDLEVTFWVLADGTVDRVQVQPSIKDRKFAKKIDDAMRGYRFKPALGPNGQPVASTFVQTMRF